jgi:arylsulfatase A
MKWLSVFLLLLCSQSVFGEKPNIIIIMADDMGAECIGAHGSLDYKTPHLDKMASRGIKFNNCFAMPICTASRVKMMTGRYNFKNYQGFGILPETETTFGTRMQAAGYTTCIAGKWQLGGDTSSPHRFGFDEYCLINGIVPKEKFDRDSRGKDRYWGKPAVVANEELYESEEDFGPDMVSEYVVNFIKKKKEKPFFLYYPMILPHSPFAPTPLSKDGDKSGKKTSELKYFPDMVHYVDVLVGRVVKALEESGQRENTIIMFTGDNGTTYPVSVTVPSDKNLNILYTGGHKAGAGKEGPITNTSYGRIPGGKDLMKRRGTHVPMIIDWPQYNSSYKAFDHTSDDLIDFSDFCATAMDLGGVTPVGDGISFLPRLKGEGASKRDFIFCHYWYFGRDASRAKDAIHDGRWKLYNNGDFYDTKTDPEEERSLADQELTADVLTIKNNLISSYKKARDLSLPNEFHTSMPKPAKKKKSKKGKKK